MYFIFLFMKKELPKKIPPWELNNFFLKIPQKYPLPASIKRPLPYQRYRLMSQEISKRAAMDESLPPSKLEWFINVITSQADRTRQQDDNHDTSIW